MEYFDSYSVGFPCIILNGYNSNLSTQNFNITNVANDAVNNYINVDFVPGDSFGIPIANYNYSLDDGLSWIALSPSDNLTPITITNVTDGANYAIRLQAVNIYGGVSEGSNSIEFTFIPNDTLATEAGPSITTDDGRFIFVG